MSLVLLIWLDAANVLSVPWWAYVLFVLFAGWGSSRD